MPTTRGTNFDLTDSNLAFVYATVMTPYVKRWLRPPPIPAEALAAVTAGPS